ncbi:MAG: folK [Burkholderiaceae bacterium]|nr:folK [Burkholderiaceae bacterium]
MTQVTAYIGLGANMGDARSTVLCAIDALAKIPHTQLQAQSRLYASAPMGENATGEHYVNAVVQLRTRLPAHDLLNELHRIERAFGRERSVRNAPRTLDLDILLYGDVCIEDEALSIPHPRMVERAFVLRPLFDIAPELSWHNAHGQKINLASQLKHVAQQEIQLLGTTA